MLSSRATKQVVGWGGEDGTNLKGQLTSRRLDLDLDLMIGFGDGLANRGEIKEEAG